MAISHDPLEVAMQVVENAKYFYGSVQVSGRFVTLRKGEGKQAFIDGQDDIKDRRTDLALVLIPLSETGLTRIVERTVIAESAEYKRIVWPSLEACGLKRLKDLDGMYAKIELVKNGRSWNDKETGDKKEGTTFKFLALYTDEAACVAGFEGDGNTARTGDDGNAQEIAAASIDLDTPLTPAPAPTSTEDGMKAVALQFLPTLVKQANGNLEVLAKKLQDNQIVAKYFDVTSPEVVQLLAA